MTSTLRPNKFQAYSIKYQNLSNRMQRLRHSVPKPIISISVQKQSINNKSNFLSKTQSGLINNNSASLLLMPQNNTLNSQRNNYVSAININVSSNLPQDINDLAGTNQYTGRVAKNTGIKKYNQRMLKQIGNINNNNLSNISKKSPPKYSAHGSLLMNQLQNVKKVHIENKNMHIDHKIRHSEHGIYNFQVNQINNFKKQRSEDKNFQSLSRPYYEVSEFKTQTPNSIIETSISKPIIKNILKLEPGRIYSKEELEEYFKSQKMIF